MDESPKQLDCELRKPYQDKQGVIHQDSEYKREGATELVMITEPLGGRREVRVEDNHNGVARAIIIAYTVEQMHPPSQFSNIGNG